MVVATTVFAAVILGGVLLWQPWSTQFETASMSRMKFPLPEKPSIAVLPFDNLSSDPTCSRDLLRKERATAERLHGHYVRFLEKAGVPEEHLRFFRSL